MLAKFCWGIHLCRNKTIAYAVRRFTLNGKQHIRMMHTYIKRPKKGYVIDHINNNGLDNRKCNLRYATHSQNMANRCKRTKSTTSKFVGVSFDKNNHKWIAHIRHNKVRYTLGRFITEIDAAKAYNKAARKFHKKYAHLNSL